MRGTPQARLLIGFFTPHSWAGKVLTFPPTHRVLDFPYLFRTDPHRYTHLPPPPPARLDSEITLSLASLRCHLRLDAKFHLFFFCPGTLLLKCCRVRAFHSMIDGLCFFFFLVWFFTVYVRRCFTLGILSMRVLVFDLYALCVQWSDATGQEATNYRCSFLSCCIASHLWIGCF